MFLFVGGQQTQDLLFAKEDYSVTIHYLIQLFQIPLNNTTLQYSILNFHTLQKMNNFLEVRY